MHICNFRFCGASAVLCGCRNLNSLFLPVPLFLLCLILLLVLRIQGEICHSFKFLFLARCILLFGFLLCLGFQIGQLLLVVLQVCLSDAWKICSVRVFTSGMI